MLTSLPTARFPPPIVPRGRFDRLPWGFMLHFSGRNLQNGAEPVDAYLVVRKASDKTVISNRTEALFGQKTAVWETPLVVQISQDVTLDTELLIECRDYDIGSDQVGCGSTLFTVSTCLRELTLRDEERSATFISSTDGMILVLERWSAITEPPARVNRLKNSIVQDAAVDSDNVSQSSRSRRFRLSFRGEKFDKKDMGGLKNNDAFLMAWGTPLLYTSKYPHDTAAVTELQWRRQQILRLIEKLNSPDKLPATIAMKVGKQLDPAGMEIAREMFNGDQFDWAFLTDLLYQELGNLELEHGEGVPLVQSTRDTVIARTEIITAAKPKWNPVEIDTMWTGGMDQPFTLAVYDWDKDGSVDFVGAVQVTMASLLAQGTPRSFTLINSTKRKSSLLGKIGLYRNAGTLILDSIEEVIIGPDNPERPLLDDQFYSGYRLTMECKNLVRMDGLLSGGKSDPFVVIRAASAGGFPSPSFFDCSIPRVSPYRAPHRPAPAWSVVAKTEPIMNNLSPTWKPIELDTFEHCGGLDSPLRVEVYDFDDTSSHDLIGTFDTTLRQLILIGQTKTQIPLQIPGKSAGALRRNRGLFSVTAVEPIVRDLKQQNRVLSGYKLHLQARQLVGVERKLGKLKKSGDPFLIVHAQPYGSNRIVPVYKSEVHKANLRPTFEPFTLDVLTCGGWDSPIRLEIVDWDRDFTHDHMCDVTTTLRELTMPVSVIHFPNGKSNIKVLAAEPVYEDATTGIEPDGHLPQFPRHLGYLPQLYAPGGNDGSTLNAVSSSPGSADLSQLLRDASL